MSTGAKKTWVGVGVVLLAALVGLLLWRAAPSGGTTDEARDTVAVQDPASTGEGRGDTSAPTSPPRAPHPRTCCGRCRASWTRW